MQNINIKYQGGLVMSKYKIGDVVTVKTCEEKEVLKCKSIL